MKQYDRNGVNKNITAEGLLRRHGNGKRLDVGRNTIVNTVR